VEEGGASEENWSCLAGGAVRRWNAAKGRRKGRRVADSAGEGA